MQNDLLEELQKEVRAYDATFQPPDRQGAGRCGVVTGEGEGTVNKEHMRGGKAWLGELMLSGDAALLRYSS